MPRRYSFQALIFSLSFLASLSVSSAAAPLVRVPAQSLRMPAAPPVYGYATTNAFGNLTFTNPVAIATPPGETNRVFVVEQRGYVTVITNLAAPNRTVFLDLTGRISGGIPPTESGLLGLTFHPQYASNGYFYVFYTGTATTAVPGGTNTMHDILARFETSTANRNQALGSSEVRLITQRDEANNHNGGDLHFGPDGYLYVSLGDVGGGDDQYFNSQTITKDFFSGILRIDVDQNAGNLLPNAHPSSRGGYRVPADNPYVGATSFNGVTINPANVRTEFWAVGLRNPWRFSFDALTGTLFCGDVGQNAWEEVDVITRGGNYGWAYREALAAGPRAAPAGFTSIAPILYYGHGGGVSQGFSVTGGRVYRGERMPQLTGTYVFADYVSGNVWAVVHSPTNTGPTVRLLGETGISAFGTDPRNGDLLMANQNQDTIRRLVYSPNSVGTPFPPTLAETGAFADVATLEPAAGVVAYDLNLPFWSDNAIKQRWFSVPDTNQAIVFSPDGNWQFPTGTVWIKHFELELTNGVPASRQRLETRLVVKNAAGVYGVTYRWGNSRTNATLVPEEGMNESFPVSDGTGVREQVWRYPSRQECLMCHTPQGGFAAGFNTAQLNRTYPYAGGTAAANQIKAMSDAGYFTERVTNTVTLPALAHWTNGAVSREYRVRSYLAANCAQCHQPGGAPQSSWDARLTTATDTTGIINGLLVDSLGDESNRVVVLGQPQKSVLLKRIATVGNGRMPPIASSLVDSNGVELLTAWITNDLPAYVFFADWQRTNFGSTNAAEALPEADPDGDRAVNELEFLTGTDPKLAGDSWAFGIKRDDGPTVRLTIPQPANRAFEVQSATAIGPIPNWTPLQVPGNEPMFPATGAVKELVDAIDATNRFYRVRLFGP